MKITVECENICEYEDLIDQLKDEGLDYQAKKRVTEWLEPEEEGRKPLTF